jgi:hypothetical protein
VDGAPIFISYSHQDKRWLEQLQNHLRPYIRNRSLAIWVDTQMAPGTKWREEMERALNAATVAILLVSSNYLASDFIANEELAPLLEAAETRGLRIVWIAVSASAYKETLVGQYEAVNDPSRPLDRLDPPERNREWVRIGQQIKTLLEGSDGGNPPPPPGEPQVRSILIDEAHGQLKWLLPPTIDQGYHRAALLSRDHDILFRAWTDGELPVAINPQEYAAVILVNAPHGRFHLTEEEVRALKRYVADGGGLMAMATYTGDWHHESNLNEVVGEFGLEFNRDLIMPATAVANESRDDGRYQVSEYGPGSAFDVEAVPVVDAHSQAPTKTVPMLVDGVRSVLTLSSCSVGVSGGAEVVLRSVDTSQTFVPLLGVGVAINRYKARDSGPADLLAVSERGAGRVAAVGGFKMFLDRFMTHPDYDNAHLFENLVRWLAGPAKRANI